MALWGKLDQANNAPKQTSVIAGTANRGNTIFGNTTPNAIVDKQVVGLFGVDQTEAAVKGRGVTQGWNLVRTGTGPITAITAAGGVNFANGDTITVSNGSANAIGIITTNGTGNLASIGVPSTGLGSGYVNASVVVTGFNREKRANNINYTGTATGYSNTDVARISNAIINATATVSTNNTGGSLTFTFVNKGTFSNATSNSQVVITIANSTGGASGGSGATFTTANLVASTGGTLAGITVGGRSGRTQYENIAVVRSMTNAGADAEDTIFPDS
jgi:hypothetical protein